MADIVDLIAIAAPSIVPIQDTWYGRFGRAPALVTDDAYVIIPDIDLYSLWGPCHWGPRVIPQTVNVAEGAEGAHNIVIPAIILPALNDECLVMFDNRRNPWVVSWWPAS